MKVDGRSCVRSRLFVYKVENRNDESDERFLSTPAAVAIATSGERSGVFGSTAYRYMIGVCIGSAGL